MSSSSQDPMSTGEPVAFSSKNRLNQETFSDRDDFPIRHQQFFGSDEPFVRFSNLANATKSLLDGNRDHFLNQTRSELVKQEQKAEATSVILKRECKVHSPNTCIRELQRQTHSQRLELDDAQCGNEEARREQTRLQEELEMREKALRDTRIQTVHGMEELQRAQEMRVSHIQELQERANYMIDSKEFQDFESNCSGKSSHVPSQPAVVPSPRSMLSRDRSMPRDTWNLSGAQGNVFGNPRSMFDSSQTPYPGILHSTNPSVTGGIPVQISTGRPVARSEEQFGSTTTMPMSAGRPSTMIFFLPAEVPQNSLAGQQRLQTSELQFENFPTPSSFCVGA